MRVLIVHASRYGSTEEVAETVGDVLREAGHDVVVWSARELPSPRNYDVVVAGSAVYGGRVLRDLERYIAKYRGDLASKRVALFAVSGSLRDDTEENHRQTEAALAPLEREMGCIARGSFAGAIDLRRMPLPIRLFMRLVRARSGDYRKWEDIRAWADGLSKQLAE